VSIPIERCLYYRATRDEKAYRTLLSALSINRRFASLSIRPCPHRIKCRHPGEEALRELEERLNEDLNRSPGLPRLSPAERQQLAARLEKTLGPQGGGRRSGKRWWRKLGKRR